MNQALWVLDLICCDHDDGHSGFASEGAARDFRESYLDTEGHDRIAILREAEPGDPMGWFK